MLSDFIKQTVLAGIGAISLTKEMADKWVEEAVKKGQITKEEAKQFLDEVKVRGQQEREHISRAVKEELERWKGASFATRADIERIEAELRELRALLQEKGNAGATATDDSSQEGH